MTVCQLYAKQNSQRADVKRRSKKAREYLMGLLWDSESGYHGGRLHKFPVSQALQDAEVGFNYNNMIRGLVKKYNQQHKSHLLNTTPHSLRHTFYTLHPDGQRWYEPTKRCNTSWVMPTLP